MKRTIIATLALLAAITTTCVHAQRKATLDVQVNEPGIKVSPDLYGIFFEEINLAGDGGIYPELVRNCSFEFNNEKPEFWSTADIGSGGSGKITLEENGTDSEFNRMALRIECKEPGFAVVNEGYWGIPINDSSEYEVVIRAKAGEDYDSLLEIMVISADLAIIRCNRNCTPKLEKDWKTYTFRVKSITHDPKAKLVIAPVGTGTVWLDYVSLKPVNTYNNNGLRPDLMEKLAALKPAFVRFPGGCWVEGDTMKEASRWKKTIGEPRERWTQPNLWGYQSTNGLGYHEYLQMCEDLGASAMFVINCGMAHKDHIPMDKMEEYVQDALDAIEYANGPADSEWGSVRAKAGHPEPFNMKYLQVGNENGGPVYWERYDLFYTKIREKYPEMEIIACQWGGAVTNKKPIEIYDEHYYSDPAFFVRNANRYDTYDRSKHKIYVGEYAVTRGCGLGNLNAAIGEAAFMTGMEKNADVVVMSSYAPLFTNVNHRRWNPDLICFDGTRSYGIPSYYVQQLFSVHRSDTVVPTEISETAEEVKPCGRVGVGSWRTQVEYKDAKVVKDGETVYDAALASAPKDAIPQRGEWKFENGVLAQKNAGAQDCRYMFGDTAWSDTTFTVKARKVAGEEGFLILFNARDDNDWAWVNIGGWGNQGTAFQTEAGGSDSSPRSDFTVETGRWYDIRVEAKGNQAKCFVDGKLVAEATLPKSKNTGVYAVSGLNEAKDELIMKIVNTADQPCDATINLAGATNVAAEATTTVLTSENGLDENTLDEPEKVKPVSSSFKVTSPTFKRTLPAKSLTIIRVGVKGQ